MRSAIRFMGLTLALATGVDSRPNPAVAAENDGPSDRGITAAAADPGTGNWPGWRGGDGSGVSAERDLPTRWNAEEGVVWKTPVPGAGNSSPVVWGERIFLATSESGRKRSVLCFDRANGKPLWQTAAPSQAAEKSHKKNGFASSTPATDGERVYAFFGSAGMLAVDFDGKSAWHRDLGEFTTQWGTASSPVLFEDMVIVNCDQDGEASRGCGDSVPTRSFLVALNKRTGEQVWRVDRSDQPRSWSTPVLVPVEAVDARDAASSTHIELVLNGGNRVWAYDPRTGEALWNCSGTTQWVTPTVVHGDGLVFAVSGRNGPTLAIRPGGRGDVTSSHVVWQAKKGGPYIPSPILVDGRLTMVNDGGIVTSYDAKTGEQLFQQRIPSSEFSVSLVYGDGKLYITSESGDTFVLSAGSEFRILTTNSLGERSLCTPALAGGRIYLRTERHLWCIGKQ